MCVKSGGSDIALRESGLRWNEWPRRKASQPFKGVLFAGGVVRQPTRTGGATRPCLTSWRTGGAAFSPQNHAGRSEGIWNRTHFALKPRTKPAATVAWTALLGPKLARSPLLLFGLSLSALFLKLGLASRLFFTTPAIKICFEIVEIVESSDTRLTFLFARRCPDNSADAVQHAARPLPSHAPEPAEVSFVDRNKSKG